MVHRLPVVASVLVFATHITSVLTTCGHGTILHPRAANGKVEVGKFGYIGTMGPVNWVTLDPQKNSLCSNGRRQSPINMEPGSFSTIRGSELSIDIPDMAEGTEFENLGTTVEVIAKGGSMNFQNVSYRLQQFHFHLPSEHLDNGRSMAMEMHMVWQGCAGQVAVFGVFMDINGATPPGPGAPTAARPISNPQVNAPSVGSTPQQNASTGSGAAGTGDSIAQGSALEGRAIQNQAGQQRQGVSNAPLGLASPTAALKTPTVFETVFNSAENITAPGTATKTPPLVMSELVNALRSGSFQTYEGSLTTPPCSEGVRWFVSDQKMPIPMNTFAQARSVIGFNSRFPQNVIGRENVLSFSRAQGL